MIGTKQLRKFIVIFAITGVVIDISLSFILGKVPIEIETRNTIINFVRALYYSILVGSMTWYLIRKITK